MPPQHPNSHHSKWVARGRQGRQNRQHGKNGQKMYELHKLLSDFIPTNPIDLGPGNTFPAQKKKPKNSIAFAKSTWQRIYPKQQTP